MQPGRLVLLVFGVAALIAALSARARAVEIAPASGVVLLHNGQVLLGKTTTIGDRVEVEIESGSVVRMPLSQVKLISPTMEGIYQQLKLDVAENDVDSRLHLGEWCFRQRLWSQATEQLVAAMQLDPTNIRAAQLEERLRGVAASRDDKGANPVDARSHGEKIGAERGVSKGEARLEATAPSLLGVSALAAMQNSPGLVRLPRVGGTEPATYEVQTLVAKLPAEVLGEFAEKIQPILLNRCATGACHGNSSALSYKLLRLPSTAANPKRFTQRNLYLTLHQVDVVEPERSPLLKAIDAAHGTVSGPVFHDHERKLRDEIAAWVLTTAQAAGGGRPRDGKAPGGSGEGPRLAEGNSEALQELAGGAKAPETPAKLEGRGRAAVAPATLAKRLSGVAQGGMKAKSPPQAVAAGSDGSRASPESAGSPSSTLDPLDPAKFNETLPR